MRKLLLLVLVLVSCTSYSVRVAELETALKKCRASQAAAPQSAEPRASSTLTSTAVVPSSTPSAAPVTTTVDYSQSLADVEQEFDWVSPNITDEHFPPEQGGTAQITLEPVKLHRDGEDWISTDEALKRLGAQGMRPATARELRAFAKANPDYQRRFLLVALGSSWVYRLGRCRVPGLSVWNGERVLRLFWTDDVWGSHWRFLAVRK